jgi:pimeloyl-ACP methyl ester carboxylesterase
MTHGNKVYKMESFDVYNPNGEKLSCSFLEPKDEADRSAMDMPCVIYMHGNASCKMEGIELAQDILPLGVNLCCFDFSGCGNSEGEWVTLGMKEDQDLKSVIEYLYENKRVSSIILWGRSMGAVTALHYVSDNEGTVNAVVLDSGFTSMKLVVDTLAGQMGVPPEFVQMLLPMLEMQIAQSTGIQGMLNMDVEPWAKKC